MAHSAYQPKRIPIPFRLVMLALALVAAPPLMPAAFAVEAVSVRVLKELDPETRLATLCNAEAMSRIAHDIKKYRPERAVEGATKAARIDGDSLIGEGAAFRSKGKWYRLSYTCKTNDDHMKVLDFTYKVGDMIPESDWQKYELWD